LYNDIAHCNDVPVLVYHAPVLRVYNCGTGNVGHLVTGPHWIE